LAQGEEVQEHGAAMAPAPTNGYSPRRRPAAAPTRPVLPVPSGPPRSFAPPVPVSIPQPAPAPQPKAKRARAASKGNDSSRGEGQAKVAPPSPDDSRQAVDAEAAGKGGGEAGTGAGSEASGTAATGAAGTAAESGAATGIEAEKHEAVAQPVVAHEHGAEWQLHIAPVNPLIKLKAIVADSAAMQGRRQKQEDRHVKVPDLTKAANALKMPIDHLEQPCAFFGVYDGHQGDLCSDFVAKNFHMKLLKKLTAQKSANAWTEQLVASVLKEVFEELDDDFLAKYRTAPDGSTAVVAFVTGTRLFVAWAGDSRCLLCHSTVAGEIATVALTEDHRPSLKSEADRVEKAGGVVVNLGGAFRVAHEGYEDKVREIRRAAAQGLGVIAKEPVALAVSRSLGDRYFKSVTGAHLLLATPGVRCLRLDKSHKFLALMCDGISDVMRDEQAVFELDYVREAASPQAEVKTACGALVQEAYKRGSEDNLTVLLARLQWADVNPARLAEIARNKEVARLKSQAAAAASASTPLIMESSPAKDISLPGESAVDALKRKHRTAAAEREAGEPAAKVQKTDDDDVMEPTDKNVL